MTLSSNNAQRNQIIGLNVITTTATNAATTTTTTTTATTATRTSETLDQHLHAAVHPVHQFAATLKLVPACDNILIP